MSVIRPFGAIRYKTDANRDLSPRLAPPYDVLDEKDKRRLLAGDPRNFVEVDLPHLPPKHAGPPAAYERASATLKAWLADGTLVKDEVYSLYVYHQEYEYAGTRYVRKMFFARLRLEPFGAGSVFPHEQTFGGPKEDRLCLTKATAANMSPIFGLYQDGENAIALELEAALPDQPLAVGVLDGTQNRLWAVNDAAVIRSVAQLMATRPTFIADGHHRYGTAMMYRDWLVAEHGPLPDDHPANFVLCAFCAMEDPGLLILPTHRVLPGVQVSRALLAGDTNLDVLELSVPGPDEAIAALDRRGPQAVALYDAADGSYVALRPKEPDLLKEFEPAHTDAWRRLGLAFLHAYLLDRVITPKVCRGTPAEISYVKSAADAVAKAKSTKGCVFLMQPTTMTELRDVCQSGDLMPQKSTFFYPKLASGLVVNPLRA